MANSYNKSKLKKNVININNSLNSLATELKNMHDLLDTMMKGNADGPYWNGGRAQNFYKKAISNLKNDIDDYKKAYNRLSSIAVTYEKLAKNDK